jgi:hypothetical protein
MFQLLARRTNITEEIIEGLRNWLTDCIGDNALNEAQSGSHAALGAQRSVMSPLVERQKTANNPTPCTRQNRQEEGLKAKVAKPDGGASHDPSALPRITECHRLFHLS